MRFLLLRAWPALIPIALYLLWLFWRARRAKKRGDAPPALLSGPWIWTLATSLALLAISLFYLGLSAENNAGASYAPKQFKDGQLIEETLQ